METASKMGYKNLETASYDNGKIYGLAPAEFKKMVNDLGMKCTSAHLGQAFTKEKEAEVELVGSGYRAHNELGVKIHGSAVDAGTRPDDFGRFEDVLRLFQYRWLQDGSRQHRVRLP